MRLSPKRVLCVAIALSLILVPTTAFAKRPHTASVTPQQVISVPTDAYESDDGTATAKPMVAVSVHTHDHGEDEDWVVFAVSQTELEAGITFSFETQLGKGNYDYDIYMYIYELNPDGSVTLLGSQDDHDYFDTYSEYMRFTPHHAGTYYVVVKPYDTDDTGYYTLYCAKGPARRVAGTNRYATAVEVSKLMYQQMWSSYDWEFSLDGIVIASGTSYADALAGGLLASAIDSPLLLSGPAGLDAATQAEVGRLLRTRIYNDHEPVTIYVLGGTGAVPPVVETQLRAIPEVASAIRADLIEIERIAGSDRYDTAARIAHVVHTTWRGLSTTALIVSGTAWADALAAAAPSVYAGMPILLTKPSSLPTATVDAIDHLGITQAVVIGGTGIVSPDVFGELEDILGPGNVVRIAGDDRYETARLVATWAVDDVGLSSDACILVSGQNWPDAAAASPMVYHYQSSYGVYAPILLTPSAHLSPEIETFIDDYGYFSELCYVIGGTGAVSETVLQELARLAPYEPPIPD